MPPAQAAALPPPVLPTKPCSMSTPRPVPTRRRRRLVVEPSHSVKSNGSFNLGTLMGRSTGDRRALGGDGDATAARVWTWASSVRHQSGCATSIDAVSTE